MKKHLLSIFLTLCCITYLQAQNPYQSLGVEAEVLTLSKGKYKEFHPNDTIVQIGTVLFNTITGEVVAFVEVDTLYSEATLEPEIVSRWMSPDPLADEFPSWSPYNFVMDNPINLVDPDGRAPKPPGDYYDTKGNYLYSDGIDDNKVYEVSSLPAFSSDLEGASNNTIIKYIGQVEDVFVTGDAASDTRIQSLHPAIRMKTTNFIKDANESSLSTLVRVAQGFRTFSEQDALYAKGRTAPGGIVTNAKGGYSNHNFGLAFDIVGITNGKVDYNLDWSSLSTLGKAQGFEWGGDWKFTDKPHFQNLFGGSVRTLREKYNSGNLINGYIDLSK